MKQKTLINKINRLIPEALAIVDYDDKDAIYFRGSEDYDADGVPIFDYWNQGETFGVNPRLAEILDDAGWYGEPENAGILKAYN